MSRLFSYDECVKWALGELSFDKDINDNDNDNTKKKKKKNNECDFGNKMISTVLVNGKEGNYTTQWTTRLGEQLVKEVLEKQGKQVWRPKQKEKMRPDWETNEYVWEVKSRNWNTPGTAGEKVLGTMYKYSDIPRLYGKPLKIVCVAYQEYEVCDGSNCKKIFGEVSSEKKGFLEYAKQIGIEYIKFSDLL